MRSVRWFGRWLLYTLIIAVSLSASAARAQDTPATAQITTPGDGAQLFGAVNITGSALHPSAFDRYTLEYDLLSDVGDEWAFVQEPVTQQVQDGVLGTWDTSAVPDGLYRLRLRVYLDSGDYAEAAISNLRVQNSQPTPVPTIAPAGVAPGLDVATPGPTPTSPIIQPPASNPQPAPDTAQVQTGPVDAGSSASLLQRSSSDTQINFERVRQAFCSGGVIAAGVFLAIALYFGVRRLSRGGQRHPLAGDNY
ncbi:MAG: hypothetical protein GX613_13955 [Chloroflexi bacterium]|nr:hypothetical protein [Chloroflexota bacterium]